MNIPLIVVILYVCLLLGISLVVSKSTKKDGTNFLLYKGKNNTWLTAVTVAGLAIGGASTIGIAENAYHVGLSAGWYDVAWAIGAIVASQVIIKKLRNSGYNTITKLIEQLYDKKASVIVVIAMIIIQCGIIALQYIAGGSILASLLPDVFNKTTGTFFSFLIFMLISFVGGMGSVSLSNILNISLIYLGVIVAAVMVLGMQGGWKAATQMAASSDVPYMSLTAGMGWIAIIAWIVVMCGNTNSVQGVVQIGLTSKDDKSASRGFILGAVMMIPVGFICAMLGVASKALIPNGEAFTALPQILLSLPPLLAGLTLSGLWAADMSTACSMLIGCATTVSQDVFYQTKIGKKYENRSIVINKVIILTVGIITYLVSAQFDAILDAMKKSLSLAIGTSIIVVAGLCFPKFAGKRAGFWTIVISIVSILVWNMVPEVAVIFKDIAYFMCTTCLVTFFGISLFDSQKVQDGLNEIKTAADVV